MFEFFKKSKKKNIYAPMNGKAINIYDVPDEAFSSKMLGDGVALIPSSGEIVSPVNGRIEQVVSTSHAYAIKSEDGLDILIHVGINTVNLNGRGFEVFVEKNQDVKVGDLIAKVDLDILKSESYNIHTPIVVTNINEVKELNVIKGPVSAGSTVIMSYSK